MPGNRWDQVSEASISGADILEESTDQEMQRHNDIWR